MEVFDGSFNSDYFFAESRLLSEKQTSPSYFLSSSFRDESTQMIASVDYIFYSARVS